MNNKDIKSYNLETIRNQIIYLDQKKFLFNDTILNNLTLGVENINKEAVIKAVKMTNIFDVINGLDNKFDFVIEEGGKNLSLGQCQRISIARSLLKNPLIIIFDEATSNIDVETEKIIFNNLKNEYKKTMCIFISHRQNILEYCEKLFF